METIGGDGSKTGLVMKKGENKSSTSISASLTMPHMQHAGTILYVGVCVRTATTNQMVSSTRPEAEVLGTRVNFLKYS